MDKQHFVAKQKVFSRTKKVFAYELLFRDYAGGIKEFPTNIKATSSVLINVLLNVSELLEDTETVLVNVDEEFLLSGLIDLLDENKFTLEILETTDLNEKVIAQVKQYHKRGFKIAIDDFDCTKSMIEKFKPIFKYTHLVKIDLIESASKNLENMLNIFKQLGLKTLAEKIETQDEYERCVKMGFDFFQGYVLHKPETLTIEKGRDLTEYTILNLIKLIRSDSSTEAIVFYIKQQSSLSFKLIEFLNAQGVFTVNVESVLQAITLLGRERLLRWLLLYLYSGMSDDPRSATLLQLSLKRAEFMETHAREEDKEKAYLAGMFSLIGPLFKSTNQDVLKDVNLDKDIEDLVLREEGKFKASLLSAQYKEYTYFKKLCSQNFEKIDPMDILNLVEKNNIEIDTDMI